MTMGEVSHDNGGVPISHYSEIMLRHENNLLNRRIDRLRKTDADWYELKGWLRLCRDTPEGHAEFYQWAAHYMFGDEPPEDEGEL